MVGYKEKIAATYKLGDQLIKNGAPQNDSYTSGDLASILEKGELVSDDIVVSLVKNRLEEADCQNGCIL